MINVNQFKLTSDYVGRDKEDNWQYDEWKCVLVRNRKQFTFSFKKGIGHYGEEPKLKEVLECLMSDFQSVLYNNSFENWASELGYDPDSRKAEKIYKQCQRQAKRLLRLMTEQEMEQLWEKVTQ